VVIEIINTERLAAARWFGESKTIEMIESSRLNYERLFVDSGFKDVVYETFYTDQRLDRGNAAFNWVNDEKIFAAVNERLEALFYLLQAMLFRFDLFMICLLLSLLILVPTVIDGLCRWQISRSSDQNASINVYNVSERIFYLLLTLPIYAFFLPMAITPVAFSVWMGVLCVAIYCMASNLQHRI
jgi:hypothetical protein